MAIIYPVPYYILGNSADKIVSMRLYDKKYDENNPNWWINKTDIMMKMDEKDYNKYRNDRIQCKHSGIIVKYEEFED